MAIGVWRGRHVSRGGLQILETTLKLLHIDTHRRMSSPTINNVCHQLVITVPQTGEEQHIASLLLELAFQVWQVQQLTLFSARACCSFCWVSCNVLFEAASCPASWPGAAVGARSLS